ncbi:CPBP family intramembrane glutamic endopeptidase [Tropicibacter sp. R15_0]|uniref:CPBP family intramembrane glutamic endopeptidase n=1 Tax=Tropicibacter sp. R15_0 TaxID=2821101 RepID=UPI0025711F6A|nr:CPBP family intramembrane glutamic endopeptidase [Tropicibacter sp. R15_0]
MSNKYAPFERMVTAARPSSGLRRLALGLVAIAFLQIVLVQAVFAIIHTVASGDTYFRLISGIQRADTPGSLLAVLILTGCMGLGVIVASELVHQRPFRSLFGPLRPAIAQFWVVLRMMIGLTGVIMALMFLTGEPLLPGLSLGHWLMLLPLTIVALLIQTGAEELVFRGYFQSQLAARFANPMVWMFVPSTLFAMLHYQPEVYGSNASFLLIWSLLFGIAAADLTARTGTLGPAIALHFANNFTALALVSLYGDMSGLALWQLPFGPEAEAAIRAEMPAEFLFIVIYWLAARLALRV